MNPRPIYLEALALPLCPSCSLALNSSEATFWNVSLSKMIGRDQLQVLPDFNFLVVLPGSELGLGRRLRDLENVRHHQDGLVGESLAPLWRRFTF